MPNNRIDDLLNMGAGSEAQMLGVEGERTAFPGSNSPRGMSMREYWDVFPEEEPLPMKVAEAYVDFFDPNRPLKWFMDLMDEYGGLKEESERIIEKSLSTEEAQAETDDELSRYNPANFGDAIPPEAMAIISGMVDPGGKAKGLMSLFKNFFKGGKGARRSEKIATENIDESKRLLRETTTTPEGTIRIEQTINPKKGGWREDVDPSQKPPFKLKGGGHLYQKGYYGKRYK